MVEEMHEAGVIGDELVALYRAKNRAFTEACARHTALLAQYKTVRAGGTIDDVDRDFVTEALAHVLAALGELDLVARGIHTVVQAAYHDAERAR